MAAVEAGEMEMVRAILRPLAMRRARVWSASIFGGRRGRFVVGGSRVCGVIVG